jgi:uncharacterized damage-inducible protein DinB
MSLLKQFELLGEYNQLMNQRLYESASKLPSEILKENKGAYFKSLLGTLNHLLVGDIIWLSRFATNPSSKDALSYFANIEKPQSLSMELYSELSELKIEREKIDKLIIVWLNSLSNEDLSSKIKYTNMKGVSFQKEFASLINHLFLHQVHHRGQATTLLSQLNVDFGETDLIEIIKNT